MTKSKTLIMIPTYNSEKFIQRTINSCLNQTLQTEVWIVDNCSTDNTQNIVKEYENKNSLIKLINNDKNYGRVGNWNKCLELFEDSDYEYIKFLFTGDELLPTCIEKVEQVFNSQDNISVVVWPYIMKEEGKEQRIVRTFNTESKISLEYLYKHNFYPSKVTGALVCNTFSKHSIQGERFNEELLGAHTFSNKCVIKGDIYHINQALSVFNMDGHQSFHKQFSYLYDLETAFTKALGLENSKYLGSNLEYKYKKKTLYDNMIHSLTRKDNDFFKVMHDYVQRNKDRELLKKKSKTNLGHIVIYANSICNAHCSFCDVGVGATTGINKPNQNVAKNFSVELLEKILNDKMIKGRRIHFAFLMTEPLMSKELPKLLKRCKEENHTTKLTTNAFLLEKRAEEIVDYIDFIQVSLDGTQELHDKIRGKNFFEQALKGIRKVRELSPKIVLDINFTVSNINYKYIIPLLEKLHDEKIFINSFKIQLMDFNSKTMIKNQNEKYPNIKQVLSSLTDQIVIENIDIDILHKQLNTATKFQTKYIDKIVFKPKLLDKESLSTYFNEEGTKIEKLSKCKIPWTSMAVATNGDCYWHMRCFNDYILGNLYNQDINDVYHGEKAEYFRNALEKDNYCFPACTRCCGVTKGE